MTRSRLAFCLAVVLAAGAASAQQLYRWKDEQGRTHITDTPPPSSAKGVQATKAAPSAAAKGQPAGQQPFELAEAVRNFPVVLYTSPSCKEPCSSARSALNKRAVPFKEVQVWDDATNEELKKVSGSNEVPTLMVGRSVHKGFEPGAYDALLDSARYPKAGTLPPRAQAAPPVPEGYTPPDQLAPKAEPVKPAPEPAPAGPYAPRPAAPKK